VMAFCFLRRNSTLDKQTNSCYNKFRIIYCESENYKVRRFYETYRAMDMACSV
jgi:hypothetical protein